MAITLRRARATDPSRLRLSGSFVPQPYVLARPNSRSFLMPRLCKITIAAVALTASACAPKGDGATPTPGPASQGGTPPAAAIVANGGHQPFSKADVDFMAGMIGHHAQAVEMAKWAPTHGASREVQALCARIAVGQTDEIHMMSSWLAARKQEVPPADPRGRVMPGMGPMLMPGMLTPAQMTQLDNARGAEFDRLFLTFMIQHHQGAITMVDKLLGSEGAVQDDQVYRFASDVHVDQSTEIARMSLMLDQMAAAKPKP